MKSIFVLILLMILRFLHPTHNVKKVANRIIITYAKVYSLYETFCM